MTKDIQRGIDARLEPGLSNPLRKPAPRGQVGFGPGEPVDAAVGLSADG